MADKRLLVASQNGQTKEIESLIQEKPQLLQVTDINGETALHWACYCGHLDAAKLLFEKEPRLVNVLRNNRDTVLHSASYMNQLHIVMFLLEKAPQLIMVKNDDGSTALHLASYMGQLDTVNLLFEKAPHLINVTRNNGDTALHSASQGGHLGTVKFLFEKVPQLAVTARNDGKKPIELATNTDVKAYLKSVQGFAKGVQKPPPTGNQGVKLFISYSWSARKDAVHKMADYLQNIAGFQVWIDKNNMAEESNTLQAMAKGIDEAQVVLCFYSDAYVKSANCGKEIKFADTKNKPIVPIRVERGYEPANWLLLVFQSNFRIDYFDDSQFGKASTEIQQAVADCLPNSSIEVATLHRSDSSDSCSCM